MSRHLRRMRNLLKNEMASSPARLRWYNQNFSDQLRTLNFQRLRCWQSHPYAGLLLFRGAGLAFQFVLPGRLLLDLALVLVLPGRLLLHQTLNERASLRRDYYLRSCYCFGRPSRS
jgi:hypothetical protein